jgi:hypothetical protein
MVDMTVTTGEARSATADDRKGIPADTFANRLMLARAYAGHLSIREAAERCKGHGIRMGHGAWAAWEKGAMPFDKLAVVEIVSEQLGVDADWLLNGGPLVQQKRRARWRRDEETAPTTRKAAMTRPPGPSRPPNRHDSPDRFVRTSPVRPPSARSAA